MCSVVVGVSCRNRVTPPTVLLLRGSLRLGHLHHRLLLCVSGCVLRDDARGLLCRQRGLLGQHHGLLLHLRHHRVELLGSASGDLGILRHRLRLLLSHHILRLLILLILLQLRLRVDLRHVLLYQWLLLLLVKLRLTLCLSLSQKRLGLLLLLERLLRLLDLLELAELELWLHHLLLLLQLRLLLGKLAELLLAVLGLLLEHLRLGESLLLELLRLWLLWLHLSLCCHLHIRLIIIGSSL